MTDKTGSISEFTRWTKRVMTDPRRPTAKQWFDNKETPSAGASAEALVKLLFATDALSPERGASAAEVL